VTPVPSEDEGRESADAGWPPPLAAPDSLLGKLQRGLGSGARAALAAGSVAAPTVLAAFANDPRWDRQLDERADYYARLVLALDIEVAAVEELLQSHSQRTPADWAHQEPVALEILARLVQLGSDEAAEALRREAVSGRFWLSAIESLVHDANLEPLPGWRTHTEGLAESVAARGSQWVVDAGDLYLSPSNEPWKTWSERFPEIRAAFDAATAANPAPDSRRHHQDFTAVSTKDLLLLSNAILRDVAAELATRTTEADRTALLAAAHDEHCQMRAAAIRALSDQQRAELLPVVLTLGDETVRHVRSAMFRAFVALPLALTRETAREWLAASHDWSRRRAAGGAFAAHGAGSLHDVLVSVLARELDGDADEYLVASLAEALGRTPESGPYEVLTRAFNEMRYSFGRRRYVADAIASTDPSFSSGLAADCLWDAEPGIRALAAARVSLDDPAVAARIAALAADPFEDPEVRAAAAARQ
jgi:hypothetical protein